MPDFLKDTKDVIFVTAADAFKEARDAYLRGELAEPRSRGPVEPPPRPEPSTAVQEPMLRRAGG